MACPAVCDEPLECQCGPGFPWRLMLFGRALRCRTKAFWHSSETWESLVADSNIFPTPNLIMEPALDLGTLVSDPVWGSLEQLLPRGIAKRLAIDLLAEFFIGLVPWIQNGTLDRILQTLRVVPHVPSVDHVTKPA